MFGDLYDQTRRDLPLIMPQVMLVFFGCSILLTDFLLEQKHKWLNAVTAMLGVGFSAAFVALQGLRVRPHEVEPGAARVAGRLRQRDRQHEQRRRDEVQPDEPRQSETHVAQRPVDAPACLLHRSREGRGIEVGQVSGELQTRPGPPEEPRAQAAWYSRAKPEPKPWLRGVIHLRHASGSSSTKRLLTW